MPLVLKKKKKAVANKEPHKNISKEDRDFECVSEVDSPQTNGNGIPLEFHW